MKIQAFVTTWDSAGPNAENTARRLAQHCPTRLLSSLYNRPFAEQWDYATKLFNGDIFLWVMGDVVPPVDLFGMFNAMIAAYSTREVGMYAPNIEWTSQIYNREKLREFSTNVYEVCGTDLLMTSVSKELLDVAPSIIGNSRGWYYDYALAAYARTLGKKIVRDYNFIAAHPQGSNYDMTTALYDAKNWLSRLPASGQIAIDNLVKEQARLCS